jgi:hypothetical protein
MEDNQRSRRQSMHHQVHDVANPKGAPMSRHSFCEPLEARRFLSASTLTQDQAALDAAISQYQADKVSAASALAGDRAKVKEDGKIHDPKLVTLRATLKEDELAGKNALLTDRTNKEMAVNTDMIAILKDCQDIRNDRANRDTAQLALDKAQLAKDQLTRQTHATALGMIVQNAVISNAATLNADRQAIVIEITTNGGNSALATDKQMLINDELKFTDMLAADHKTILTDRLIVAMDKHG